MYRYCYFHLISYFLWQQANGHTYFPWLIFAHDQGFPHLLNRGISPLQKVALDITCIKYRGKWFYLICYSGRFNNEIAEWQRSDSFDNLFVIRSARRLLEKAKRTGCSILIHRIQHGKSRNAQRQRCPGKPFRALQGRLAISFPLLGI